MNQRERVMLYRVFRALDEVPGCGLGGSHLTASVKGVASYANDMRVITGHVRKAIYAVAEAPHADATREEQLAEAEVAMQAAESYISARQAQNWN